MSWFDQNAPTGLSYLGGSPTFDERTGEYAPSPAPTLSDVALTPARSDMSTSSTGGVNPNGMYSGGPAPEVGYYNPTPQIPQSPIPACSRSSVYTA